MPLPLSDVTFYVDPLRGSNSNPPGFAALPWKTLTFALCVTGPGKTIRASPGTYSSASNGEQFPLVIRGQRVDATVSRGAIVQGVGPVKGATVAAAFDIQMSTTQSRLTGFQITAIPGKEGIGVLLRDGSGVERSHVQDIGVTGHAVGILARGSSVADVILTNLDENEINLLAEEASTVRINSVSMDMGLTGLKAVDHASVTLRFSGVSNSGGQNVEVSSPNVDLGRTDQSGSNTFSGAAGVNIWNRTKGTLHARGNTLSARPVTQSNVDESAHTENIANEFFPLGCTKVLASDCP